MQSYSLPAPGAPGIPPRWTTSSKDGIGTAINLASTVSFAISHGILNEIYFPREDKAATRDMGLIVTNGVDFFSEEKRNTHTETQQAAPGGQQAAADRNACHQAVGQAEHKVETQQGYSQRREAQPGNPVGHYCFHCSYLM